MSEVTLRAADFIIITPLGVVLDLEIRSNFISSSPGLVFVDNNKVVSTTDIVELDTIYLDTFDFTCSPVTQDTACSVSLAAQQALEATCSTASTWCEVAISYMTALNCHCMSEMRGFVYPGNATLIPYTGTLLYQKKIDTLDYFFTSHGIFIWHKRRERLMCKVLFPMQAAAVTENKLLLGTASGLYTVDATDLYNGTMPTLELSTATTPALTSDSILSIAVDKLDVIIKYAASFDYFVRDLSSAPLNFTGIMDGEVLNGKIYYSNAGVPTYLTLPYTSGALLGGDEIKKLSFTQTNLTGGSYTISEDYGLDSYAWLWARDGAILKKSVWLRGISGHTGKNFKFGRQVNDVIFIFGGSSVGDHMSGYSANNGVAFLHTFRLSGTGSGTTAVLLSALSIQDYTFHPAGGGVNESEYYDQISPASATVSELSGDVYKIHFYTRPYFEEKYISTYGTLLGAQGYLYSITVNMSTGDITHTRNKLSNDKSDFPALAWQHDHNSLVSPFKFRNEVTSELMYAGNKKSRATPYGTAFHYVAGVKKLLSFSDLTYTEDAPEVLPPITEYNTKYDTTLEKVDLLSLGDDRFVTIEFSTEGQFFVVLYSKIQNNKRSEGHSYAAITDPLPITKPDSSFTDAEDGFFYEGAFAVPGEDLTYISIQSGSIRGMILAVTPTAVIPVCKQSGSRAYTQSNMNGFVQDTRFYEENLISLTQTTQFTKGKAIFFVNDNCLYCVFRDGSAMLVSEHCEHAVVSEDAECSRGTVAFKHPDGLYLTKSISGEFPGAVI